jgi:hypothetical protein
MFAWLGNLRNRGTGIRVAMLGIAMLAMCAFVAPVAMYWGGFLALAAETIAGGICLAGAAAALAVTDRLRGSDGSQVALWFGLVLRTGLPCAAGVAIHLDDGPLAHAGLLCYLLVFCLTAIVVGTILSLPPKDWRQTPPI